MTKVVTTEMNTLITLVTTTSQDPADARLVANALAAADAAAVLPEEYALATASAKDDTTLKDTAVWLF